MLASFSVRAFAVAAKVLLDGFFPALTLTLSLTLSLTLTH